MQNFMQQVNPHLLMNQNYHFFGENTPGGPTATPGGSPTNLYRDMAIVSATNLGSMNNGLRGDVVVGYYEPLHPSFTTPRFLQTLQREIA